MKNYRIARFVLAADLAICSALLLCINHELYFVPLLTMLLLVRMWISFSVYRRSRMAICPIILLVAMTVYIWTDPYYMSYSLFLMPWITLSRGTLSLFGAERSAVDAIIGLMLGSGWCMKQIISAAAFAGSVWLLMLPLGLYVSMAFKKRLLPGRLALRKNIGLCFYMFGILLLISIVSTRMSIVIFFLAMSLIPLVFNRGKWLFTRGETFFMGTLALLTAGYICGVRMYDKSMIVVSLLPAVFYALLNWWKQHKNRYREIVPIVIGSVCFAGAQYGSGAIRLWMLLLAAALTAAVAISFAVKNRTYLLTAGLYLMTSFFIPVLCIGYNPYSVMSAKRMHTCNDYNKASNGLLYVHGKNGCGIRDRFDLVMPAEYSEIHILQHWMPYFMVGEKGAWQIYDIERHELVSEEFFSEILPFNDTTFILKADEADRYLILPGHYDRRAESQPAVVTDQILTERLSDREVQRLVMSLMDRLSVTMSIEGIVGSYQSEDPNYYLMMHPEVLLESRKLRPVPECAKKTLVPWNNVLACMYTVPEKVHMTDTVCPHCGKRLVELYYSSPPRTWRALCGRGGCLTICPACPRQINFELTILN